jgi:hypothetical protein
VLLLLAATASIGAASCDDQNTVASQAGEAVPPTKTNEQPGAMDSQEKTETDIVDKPVEVIVDESADTELDVEHSEEVVPDIDYNKLPNPFEVGSGERCAPMNFPYFSFEVPEGYVVSGSWPTQDSDDVVSGSLVYDRESAYNEGSDYCTSTTKIKRVDGDGEKGIYLDYIIYRDPSLGSEDTRPSEIFTRDIAERMINHNAEWYRNETKSTNYGDSAPVDPVFSPNSQCDMWNYGPAIAEHGFATWGTADYAFLLPKNPETVGLFRIVIDDDSEHNQENLEAAQQIIDSLTPSKLTYADAEKIVNDLKNQ